MKVHESVGRRCEACGETPEIRNPNKHTRFDKLKFEGYPMVYVMGLNTNGWFLHLVIAGVGESVGTQVVSMSGRISCMTQNIPYRIALFIWNMAWTITRSTGQRDSLLNGRKMWVDFRILKKSALEEDSFSLESPLTFCCYFIKGKTK